jgi:hypothetical protein
MVRGGQCVVVARFTRGGQDARPRLRAMAEDVASAGKTDVLVGGRTGHGVEQELAHLVGDRLRLVEH